VQLVAELGSLAEAARRLELDPSSVSRSVARVEASLGVRLFQRSTRHLAVTDAGAAYLARVSVALDALEDAQDAARGLWRVPGGPVRLAASVAFGHEMLLPRLAALAEELPDVSLDLILSDDPVDLVGAQVDLAIRHAPEPTGDLICQRLIQTQYRVVAAPDYLERAGSPQSPDALARHTCLRLSLPEHRYIWRFQGPQAVDVPVSGSITISSPLALRAAAREGLGLALLADWLVARDVAAGRLVALFPEYTAAATGFEAGAWLLYPSRSYLPHRIRAVIEFLRRDMPKLV